MNKTISGVEGCLVGFQEGIEVTDELGCTIEQNNASDEFRNEKKNTMKFKSSSDIARFVVDRATMAAIEVLIACAVDGSDYWEIFFEEGLIDAISEDIEYENEFFSRLCGGRGLPHAAKILDGYLSGLTPSKRRKLMDGTNIKRKCHPANLCFYGASFPTVSGTYFLNMLKVLMKHGMLAERLEYIGSKSYVDFERACSHKNDAFVDFYLGYTHGRLPPEFAENVAARSPLAENIIAYLVQNKGVDIDAFTTYEVQLTAKTGVVDFISALQGRIKKKAPKVYKESIVTS